MTGKKTITLKPEDVKEIAKTDSKKYLDAKDPTKLTIPFKEISNVSFKFNVDASSSEVKEDADNAEKLTEVYKILQSDPDPALAPIKQKVLKVLIDEIGAEGTDDLFPDDNQVGPDGQPIQQPQQQQVTPQMVQQMVMEGIQQAEEAKKQQPKSIAESLQIKFADLPEDSKQELTQVHRSTVIYADTTEHRPAEQDPRRPARQRPRQRRPRVQCPQGRY
jgi:hypothetical protein